MHKQYKIPKTLFISIIGFSSIFITNCSGNRRTRITEEISDSLFSLSKVRFNPDSAMIYVTTQCSFGPRTPNSKAHDDCGDYIAKKFALYGATVLNQFVDLEAFNGTILHSRNIIASINPDETVRIMICAHWDSRPWADHDPDTALRQSPVLGANDGASGVAVMIELSRILMDSDINVGVDFICFDSEDYGAPEWEEDKYSSSGWCLGSHYWAANPHIYGYRANFGILLDMVGGIEGSFAREGYSMEYASSVDNLIRETAHRLGYGIYFPYKDGGYVMDDHIAVNRVAGIPCADIIAFYSDSPSSFGPTWHTTFDDIAHMDRRVLEAVGQTIAEVIYNFNNRI